MPYYEYRCSSCSNEFETYRTFDKADEDAVCPVCGASAHRVFTPAGVVYHGNGYYCTDHRCEDCCHKGEGK